MWFILILGRWKSQIPTNKDEFCSG